MALQLALVGKTPGGSGMTLICMKCGFGHCAHSGFELEAVWSTFFPGCKVWHFSISL